MLTPEIRACIRGAVLSEFLANHFREIGKDKKAEKHATRHELYVDRLCDEISKAINPAANAKAEMTV